MRAAEATVVAAMEVGVKEAAARVAVAMAAAKGAVVRVAAREAAVRAAAARVAPCGNHVKASHWYTSVESATRKRCIPRDPHETLQALEALRGRLACHHFQGRPYVEEPRG